MREAMDVRLEVGNKLELRLSRRFREWFGELMRRGNETAGGKSRVRIRLSRCQRGVGIGVGSVEVSRAGGCGLRGILGARIGAGRVGGGGCLMVG